MCFLFQGALGLFLLLTTWLVGGVFHGSLLIAGIASFLVWQSRNHGWWAPWDEGLPQNAGIANVFLPVLICFALFFCGFLLSSRRATTFKKARKAAARNQATANGRKTLAPNAAK